MVVLVVDDSEIIQQRIFAIVNQCEQVTEIHFASNGTEARDLLQREQIDLVISDIRMPGGDGFDLLAYIRKHLDHLTIFVMTSYPQQQYRERAMSLGADHFLSKHMELHELPLLLETAFEV